MKLSNNAAENLRLLIKIVYPDRCVFCNTAVMPGKHLCPSCEKDSPRIIGERCFLCGCAKEDCTCKKHAKFYTGITAPFYYTSKAKSGIVKWKFGKHSENVKYLAAEVAESIKSDFGKIKFDFVCCVPQTNDEMQDRGYNQSKALAEAVGIYLHIPYEDALEKLYNTKKQHRLPWYLKSGNVFGVFECSKSCDIENKTILLIDDVMTTGASINECAKMLQIGGADRIYCGVICVSSSK